MTGSCGGIVPRSISAEQKIELIEIADRTLSVLNPRLRYVLVARWNKDLKRFTPHLTSPEGFDRDKKAILLKFYYEPKLRTVSYPTDLRGEDNEPEENLLYLNRPQMTYEEASEALGISFDSVRD